MLSYRSLMVSTLCTLAVVALLAAPASAVIIAADSFDYSQQQLAGLDGGTSLNADNGWGSPWRNASDYALSNGPDNMEATGGGTMGTNAVNGNIPGVTQGVERLIKENQATDTYYFGADIKYFNNTSPTAVSSNFGFGFDTLGGGGPDVVALMIVEDRANNGGTQTFMHGNNKSGGQSAPGVFAGSEFHRIVGRLQFQAAGVNEELKLWVNPTSESDAPGVNHNSQDLAADMDGLVMTFVTRDTYAHPSWEADNLVLATTFNEALTGIGIPEPTTLVLLGIGLAGCLASRRRCR